MLPTLVLVVVVSIVWELAEHYFKISEESFQNKAVDVIGAVVGFVAVESLLINESNQTLVLLVSSLFFVGLTVWGGLSRRLYPEIEKYDHRV